MKITVFTTQTCPYCIMVKRWLDEKKLKYKDYRVDKNPHAGQYMVQISGQRSVPLTVIEKDSEDEAKLILGFDIQQLESAINDKGGN